MLHFIVVVAGAASLVLEVDLVASRVARGRGGRAAAWTRRRRVAKMLAVEGPEPTAEESDA